MPWHGENLRRLREAASMSRDELARRAGVPVRSIENWELNHRAPQLDAILQLAGALGVDVAAFVQKPPRTPKPKRGRPRKPTDSQ